MPNALYQLIDRHRNTLYEIFVIFDIVFILLLFLEFIFPDDPHIRLLEIGFGLVYACEFIFRVWLRSKDGRDIFTLWRFFDAVILFSIFGRVFIEDFFFFHVISSLRIFRSYRSIRLLLKTDNFVSRNHEIVLSTVNLLVFIFIMTAMVFTLQVDKNPEINDYVDALYFTISTLTTTGFGDITAVGKGGKMLSVIIMVLGVGLFLKLASSIFKPSKIFHECEYCGLKRHDADASHCKHCGKIVHLHGEE